MALFAHAEDVPAVRAGDHERGDLALELAHARVLSDLRERRVERGEVLETVVRLDVRLGRADRTDERLRLGKARLALDLAVLLLEAKELFLLAERNVERKTGHDGHWIILPRRTAIGSPRGGRM